LGDTDYQLDSLDNQLTGDCHLAVSELNRLRRSLIEQIDSQKNTAAPVMPAVVEFSSLKPTASDEAIAENSSLSCLCRTMDQLEAALEAGLPMIYCDFEDPRRYKEAVALCPEVILATPRIIKPGEDGYLKMIQRAEPRGLLLRNLAALKYYKNSSSLIKIGDFSLNVANSLTAKLLLESANLDRLTISYDLNISQVLDLLRDAPPQWFELTLHQHMPLFHMEHCVFCAFMSPGTDYKTCGRPCEKHVVHLRDRVGQMHRLSADVGCRNTLFNGRAQTGARFLPELLNAGLRNYRIELLDENKVQAQRSIDLYQDLLADKISAADLHDDLQVFEKLGVTEGTLVEK
jgi:putative protease